MFWYIFQNYVQIYSRFSDSVVISWSSAKIRFFSLLRPEGRGFDSRWCLLGFLIDLILPAALWPWSRPEKWVSRIFPGGKGGRCLVLTTLQPSCADCLETRVPQLPGTLKACTGLYKYSLHCFTCLCFMLIVFPAHCVTFWMYFVFVLVE